MLKAIPTRYAGRLFRSRLEARWAVLFDGLDIAWEYEEQGYDCDGTPYLPDFRLTNVGWFVEVKPCQPTGAEEHKALALAGASGQPVLIVSGRPILSTDLPDMTPPAVSVAVPEPDGAEMRPVWHWASCVWCGRANSEGCRLLATIAGLPANRCVDVFPMGIDPADAVLAANEMTFEFKQTEAA